MVMGDTLVCLFCFRIELYEKFGEVVQLDATYKVNKSSMPQFTEEKHRRKFDLINC